MKMLTNILINSGSDTIGKLNTFSDVNLLNNHCHII